MTTQQGDLTGRLRWTADTLDLLSDENLMIEAADRIDELEQRNENADDMLDVAIRKMGEHEHWQKWQKARIAELEAELEAIKSDAEDRRYE